MDILIGCEESGAVRDAFAKLGHNSWSNDLIDSRVPGNHLKMCVTKAINSQLWDIIILHPDCTAMALSGNRWYGNNMPMHQKRIDALKWTKELWELAKNRAKVGCAIENPTSVLWGELGKPDYIHPWQFGHGEVKKTGILTHNLPPLKPTKIVEGREERIWRMPPGANRKRDRSETYQGVANAMALQWGGNAP